MAPASAAGPPPSDVMMCAVLVADHLLAGAAVHQQRDLVAHAAGGQEDSRLLAQHRGHARLQRVDGGVLSALLVADLGLGHGLAHGRRRPRDRVAPEIDVIAWHAALPSISAFAAQ